MRAWHAAAIVALLAIGSLFGLVLLLPEAAWRMAEPSATAAVPPPSRDLRPPIYEPDSPPIRSAEGEAGPPATKAEKPAENATEVPSDAPTLPEYAPPSLVTPGAAAQTAAEVLESAPPDAPVLKRDLITDDEPDLGQNHLPGLELIVQPPPSPPRRPRRKPLPRPVPAAAAPDPEPAPPPPPPVHERWQTLLARTPRTDWQLTVFEGH